MERLRNKSGQFVKGSGFWKGKKRPNLTNTGAAKTMFTKGFSPWNKGKFSGVEKHCLGCNGLMRVHLRGSVRKKWCSIKCKKESSFNGDIIDKKCPGCEKLIMRKSKSCKSCWQVGKTRPWSVDEKNPKWKGDRVGYYALHAWIQRKIGKPKKCSSCGSEDRKRYEWANKSGQYKRDFSDWIRLCKPCHVKYDMSRNWGSATKLYNL